MQELLDFTNPTSCVVMFFVAFVVLIILILTVSYSLDKRMSRVAAKKQKMAVQKPSGEPQRLALKPMVLATA